MLELPMCSYRASRESGFWCNYHGTNFGKGGLVSAEHCFHCQVPRSVKDAQVERKVLLRTLPIAKVCIHLGNRLTHDEVKEKQLVGCRTCTNTVPAFHCKLPGAKKFNGGPYTRETDCMNCTDWQRATTTTPLENPSPITEFSTRHLLYHIYPVSGNGAWQWNVEQLCGRLKAFNGQKIVAIAIDPPTGRLSDPTGPNSPDGGRVIPGCDSADKVRAEFAKRWPHDDITFLEFENDPKLREVKTLIPMLEMVLSDDPTHITLYAQAKGTTRKKGHIARRWTEALYEIMFDHFPLAEEQLKTYPVTGCFKKLGAGWDPTQSFSDYHFSGSWFWFRNADLYQRDWQKADQFWSGVEPYPSQHFRPSEAGCMFHEASVPAMNLYNQGYWKRTVIPQFNKWREENAKHRTEMWPR